MIKHCKNRRGFSLVETLVAISILLVSLVAPLTIASKSLQNIYFAREQYVATMLAQEGLEAVIILQRRSMLDSVKNGTASWDWFDNLSNNCKSAAGCAMDFSGNGSNPVDVDAGVTSNDCSHSSNPCAIFLDVSENDLDKYSHDSSGSVATPYNRSVRVRDAGGGVYTQVVAESEVTWKSAIFDTDESIIVRTNLFDIATSTLQ